MCDMFPIYMFHIPYTCSVYDTPDLWISPRLMSTVTLGLGRAAPGVWGSAWGGRRGLKIPSA